MLAARHDDDDDDDDIYVRETENTKDIFFQYISGENTGCCSSTLPIDSFIRRFWTERDFTEHYKPDIK